MGILDRIHGGILGAYGVAQAPFGLVKDLATAPWDDEINGSIAGVMWRRTTSRLGDVAQDLLGPTGVGGSAIGALPKGVRDPLRSITKPMLDAAEWGYREGIGEPISAAVTASSLADAGHGWDFGKAYKIAQSRSPGQAIALAVTTEDILDDVEVEKAMGGDAYSIISGVFDAAFRLKTDPTILLGKGAKVAKVKALGRETILSTQAHAAVKGRIAQMSVTTASKAFNRKSTDRFIKYIENLTEKEFKTHKLGLDEDVRLTAMGATPKIKSMIERRERLRRVMDDELAPESKRSAATKRYNTLDRRLNEEWLDTSPVITKPGEEFGHTKGYPEETPVDTHGPPSPHGIHGPPEYKPLPEGMDFERPAFEPPKLEARIDKAGLAARIRDQFFPDHPQGGLISRVIADAADSGDIGSAVRAMMGDADAMINLTARRADIASQLARIEEGAAQVERWGHYPMDNAAQVQWDRLNTLIKQEQQILYPAEAQMARLDKVVGKMSEAPRVSKSGHLAQQAKSKTWLYQKGPLSAVVHKVLDMEPVGLLRLKDGTGDVQVDRMMKASKGLYSDAERANFRMQYASAMDENARLMAIEAIEDHGWGRLAESMHPDQARIFLGQARTARTQMQKALHTNRKYDGKDRSKITLQHHITGKDFDVHLPLMETQFDQVHKMVDWDSIDDLRKELDDHFGRFGKGARIADEVLEKFYSRWKPAVLLRAGWPIRVVGDEMMRIIAKIGALNYGKEIAPAFKEGLMNRINRVPKTERPTYYAGDVRTLRNYDMERSMGVPGDAQSAYVDMIDARASFGTNYLGHEKQMLETMRSGQFESVHHTTGLRYDKDWEYAVNREIAQSGIGRQILEGKTDVEIVAWMNSTVEGRALAKQFPWRQNKANWVDSARKQVDSYVPDVGDLRQKVLEGKARATDLRSKVDEDLLPLIHGEMLKQGLGQGSVVDKLVTDILAKGFDVLGRKPTNHMARSKYFDHEYRLEAGRLTNIFDEVAIKEGRMLGPDELKKAQDGAREYAYTKMKKLLYDQAESSQFATMLRHISPFYMAWQEVVTRWTGLAIENPAFAARLRQIWMAPEKMGLVVDENGTEIEWQKGDEIDPATGQPEEWGKDRYVVLPVHSIVKDIPYFKKLPDMKFNKKSFNTILQGAPGLGPPQQLALSHIIKDKPELEDSFKRVMPFGANTDILKAFLPTTLSRAGTALGGDDNRQYVNSKLRIFNDMQVDFALEKRTEAPTWAEAERKAQDFWAMRTVAAALLPAQPTFNSPYQMHIDAYRKRKTVDPEGADQWFLDEYGEEYFALTQSVTKSMDGVAPTREGAKNREKYVKLIEAHPDLGGLIMGDEGAGEFSNSVYQGQLEKTISEETDVKQRRSLSQAEAEGGPGKRVGWMQYGKFMDLLDTELHNRGLPNYQVKAAKDLQMMKSAGIKALAVKYPDWANEFYTRDSQKWGKRLAGMQQIAEAPELQGRPEIQGLKEYLQARDAVMAELRRRDEEGGAKTLDAKGNYDLAQIWEAMRVKMAEKNLPFGQLYYRYLEHDPMEA